MAGQFENQLFRADYLGDKKFLDYEYYIIGDGTFLGDNIAIYSKHDCVDFDIVHVNTLIIEDNVWYTSRWLT
jgi:hypothetical protein